MTKIALVTGSGRGIGAATALLAAKRGYAVCINYISREERARAVADEIRDGGGRVMLWQADTADEAAVVAMFEAVDRELGRVDALVNNAGITGKAGRIDSYDAAAIRRVLDVNVTGLMLCTREAVRRERRQGRRDRQPVVDRGGARRREPVDRLRGGERRRERADHRP